MEDFTFRDTRTTQQRLADLDLLKSNKIIFSKRTANNELTEEEYNQYIKEMSSRTK